MGLRGRREIEDDRRERVHSVARVIACDARSGLVEIVDEEMRRFLTKIGRALEPALRGAAPMGQPPGQIQRPAPEMNAPRHFPQQQVLVAVSPYRWRQQFAVVQAGKRRQCERSVGRQATTRLPAPVDARAKSLVLSTGNSQQMLSRSRRQRQQMVGKQRRARIAQRVVLRDHNLRMANEARRVVAAQFHSARSGCKVREARPSDACWRTEPFQMRRNRIEIGRRACLLDLRLVREAEQLIRGR